MLYLIINYYEVFDLVETDIQYNLHKYLNEIQNQIKDLSNNEDFVESYLSYNPSVIQILNDFDSNKMLLYQIFNSHSAVMLLINPDDNGKIVLANIAASKFYGYTQEEIQSMKISDINIMPPEDIKNEMENAKKFHRNFFIFQHRLIDGSLRDVEVFSTPIFLNNSNFLFSIIHDISDRNLVLNVLKKTNMELVNSNNTISQQLVNLQSLYNKLKISEEQLIELNSGKDKFFLIISHDLKALLYTLLQYVNLVKNEFGYLQLPDFQGLINLIYDAGVNLNKLLENLLYWSNLHTGKFEMHCSDYLLKNVIDSNIQLFKPEAHFKNLIIENYIDSGSCVCIDLNILNTILRNLLSNALKFSKQNGKIKIWQYNSSEDKIVVVVEDNGSGMSEDDAACVFRIDKIMRYYGISGEEGNGIGLIIIKDLIERCGEQIWFDSIHGSGTKFFFTLSKSK
jgi:PAS domain S-box-containing protein